jgi:hypothetical protein
VVVGFKKRVLDPSLPREHDPPTPPPLPLPLPVSLLYTLFTDGVSPAPLPFPPNPPKAGGPRVRYARRIAREARAAAAAAAADARVSCAQAAFVVMLLEPSQRVAGPPPRPTPSPAAPPAAAAIRAPRDRPVPALRPNRRAFASTTRVLSVLRRSDLTPPTLPPSVPAPCGPAARPAAASPSCRGAQAPRRASGARCCAPRPRPRCMPRSRRCYHSG